MKKTIGDLVKALQELPQDAPIYRASAYSPAHEVDWRIMGPVYFLEADGEGPARLVIDDGEATHDWHERRIKLPFDV